jgi:hypothetical protein
MSLIDIKAVKAEAQAEASKEAYTRAKSSLVAQMRVVEAAKKVVRAEEQKLADIEARIEEGTL